MERLARCTPAEAKAEFGITGEGVWSLRAAQDDLRAFGISRQHVRQILYRPFDWRYIYFTHKSSGFLGRPRFEVMQHMLSRSNIGLIFNRQIVGKTVSQFGVSRDLICHGTFYLGNKGQDYLAPLYLQDDDLLSGKRGGRPSNFTHHFTTSVLTKLGTSVDSLMPEEIFHYTYALFHSPSYRSRYAEFLKIDFPRVPLTSSLELFRALEKLGGELVALHLMESPKLEKYITKYAGKGDSEVAKGYPKFTLECGSAAAALEKANEGGSSATALQGASRTGTVYINLSRYFEGVPENVWNFHIGGYQVCEKWLKDRRGRVLSDEDILHYQRVVVALNETIRLMADIDKVIEAHGGWPGAFVTKGNT